MALVDTKPAFIVGGVGKWIWRVSVMMIIVVARTSLTLANIQEKGGENNGCSAVKLAWSSKGFNVSQIHISGNTGELLQVCSQGTTCCTSQMESKMLLLGQQEFNRTLSNKIEEIRQVFTTQTNQYNAFCIELIDKASRDLHEMFVKTYGILYEQNAQIFAQLFRNLKQYYQGSNLNLEDVLDSFFATLMRHMFKLLNTSYEFDDRYLQCVTEHMDDLKPFGDVPKKLSTQVKRAFVGARTFHQGLAIGREAVNAISRLGISAACVKAVTKMSWCPYCRGFTHLKPCNNFCLNVMKGCLANHYELHDAWSTYIEWLSKMAERLEGPFNIESVIDPIDVKISDAIMNFQENNEEVSKKVFLGCGTPRLANRKRRQVDYESGVEWKQPKQGAGRQGGSRKTTAAGTSLDRLMRDFREQIAPSKDLWKALPRTMCGSMASPASEETQCWNGLSRSRYAQPVVADGLANQTSNPEVDVDVKKSNSLIGQQSLQLRMVTEKLKKAYNGQDVDYSEIDPEESTETSASGDVTFEHSGSGIGDIVPDIGFATSPRPFVRVQTNGPYVYSRPYEPDKSRPKGRVTPPTSAASKLSELPLRLMSFVVVTVFAARSI